LKSEAEVRARNGVWESGIVKRNTLGSEALKGGLGVELWREGYKASSSTFFGRASAFGCVNVSG
jgi:hypothetical protein